MEHKKTAGKQKIPLAKIENEATLYASFSKRRSTLYRKASDLVREFDVDVGIVLSSPRGKPYSFTHPTVNAVFDRFTGSQLSTQGDELVAGKVRQKVRQYSERLYDLDKREKIANEKIDFFDKLNEDGEKDWWESIDEFSRDDAVKFQAWLTAAEFMLDRQLKSLENGPSSSSDAS